MLSPRKLSTIVKPSFEHNNSKNLQKVRSMKIIQMRTETDFTAPFCLSPRKNVKNRSRSSTFVDTNVYYNDKNLFLSTNSNQKDGTPAGLFSFVSEKDITSILKEEKTEDMCALLSHQYFLLCSIFYDFPPKMIKTLLIRENGVALRVFRELKKKGWGMINETMTPYLSIKQNEIFNIPYYWGEFKDEYIDILRESPPRSYFTAFTNDNQKVICYINNNNEFKMETTSSLKLSESQRTIFALGDYIKRPKFVTIHSILCFIK